MTRGRFGSGKPVFYVLPLCVALCSATAVLAQTQPDDDTAPLSAIDWLSQSVEQPPVVVTAPSGRGTQATRVPPADEPPVTSSATAPRVTVQPLGGTAPRATGLLAPSLTGLAPEIWQGSEGDTLAALVQAQSTEMPAPLHGLLRMLLLAEAVPPLEAENPGRFLEVRVDKLLDMAALDEAQALLQAAGPETAPLFRRWFDVTLLSGTETRACAALKNIPDVAPTPAARVFCLARSGDWPAAALTLNTGRALGDIDDATGDLLARFLDPELFEGEPALPRPARISPLVFRMFEAIGDPLGTQGLPLAFAHSDLRPNLGWKAQLEAAERLAQRGAIDPNALIGLYTARQPAASGGVWERARAVQDLRAALTNGDGDDQAEALVALWDEAAPRRLMPSLATAFGRDLLDRPLPAEARLLQFKTLLLTEAYEAAALEADLAAAAPFLASVARGAPTAAPYNHAKAGLVRRAFAAEPDAGLVALAAGGQSGEAILRTLATLNQGIEGDDMALEQGLATLRALGLEDVARRTALHLLILDR